jgi:hypothetical protein
LLKLLRQNLRSNDQTIIYDQTIWLRRSVNVVSGLFHGLLYT